MRTSHPTPHAFEAELAASWPAEEWAHVGVVVAVSGGADSVALLRGLHRLLDSQNTTGELVVAHVDHGLRPEAAGDQEWLRGQCSKLGLLFETGRRDVAALAVEQGDGIEAAARNARLAFLREMAERRGARFVATAHTADDQVETVLFRILRGTGLAGLAGIRRTRPLGPSVTLIRPMLSIDRETARDYLAALGQEWRQDPTNAEPRFARNRIRNELLPQLRRDFGSSVDDAVRRLADQAAAARSWIDAAASEHAERCLVKPPFRSLTTCVRSDVPSLRIDCRPLVGQESFLVCEVLRVIWRAAGWPEQAMTANHWHRLAAVVLAGPSAPGASSGTLPGDVQIDTQGELMTLYRRGRGS
jgi:tRNA(Ile)-lysidine synthase